MPHAEPSSLFSLIAFLADPTPEGGIAELARRARYNVRTLLSNPAGEISGALGDLGTLLPIMIAMTLQGAVDLPATLVSSGVWSVVAGGVFGVPVGVQPMKAIASTSLSHPLPLEIVTASGALVSLALLLLLATNLLPLLASSIPLPLIKGIQLGAALRLALSSANLILPLPWLPSFSLTGGFLNCRVAAAILFFAAFAGQRLAPRFPTTLALFLLAAAFTSPSPGEPQDSPKLQHRIIPPPNFISALTYTTALAQLPLTLLNSILAVTSLAETLYPPSPLTLLGLPPSEETWTPSAPSTTSLALSIALINPLTARWGAMPLCHGAGGLAAQYFFGARSGSAIILLGLVKLALGLWTAFIGPQGEYTVIAWLKGFPKSVLGVMVFLAGLELAKGCLPGEERPGVKDVEGERESWVVTMVTAVGGVAYKNDGVGFVMGLGIWVLQRGERWLRQKGEGRRGESEPLLVPGGFPEQE
ncbi:uncharacterized protein CTHT_0052180 [Thermochaetoides thermophila DSM 1495]|uniref:Uncharacterized protein n=1 Tax=Chaetomium thermophilum (strain DSM 1495 / CBS 144.50 / IMI 039719) TaxID=759272 RepID=G0SDL2_CHATD|nr:hypothetical protein CTHT_0052180 [Thermochaetoides thermophila DSM 1495]EGS18613.1 hypothetical protein CTHT_0052180 [Thermochaetoides thermophila DSM 1495]